MLAFKMFLFSFIKKQLRYLLVLDIGELDYE